MQKLWSRFVDAMSRPPDLGPPLGIRSLGASIPPYQAGRPQWPAQNIETFRDQGYNAAPVVNACVNARAKAVSAATVRVYRERRGGQRQEIEDHPLRLLMQQPNLSMSETEFLLMTVLLMDAAGFAPIEKERARAGNVIGLWHLRPDWIKPIPREQAPPDWEYRVPGREPAVIPAEDIIVIQGGPSLDMRYTGLSPISVALREIGIENASTDFLKLFMERGGVPMYAMTMPNEIKDEATAQIYKERWSQSYSSFHNWANIALLHGGMDVKQIGMNLDDMAYPELRRLTEAHICMAFGVPPILIGSQVGLERSTYSNYQESRRTFYEDTIVPLWARIDGALTRGLLRELDSSSDVALEFDTSNIPALQNDENQAWQRATAAINAGAITLNQFQREIGQPGFGKAGEVLFLPFSVTPTRVDDLVAIAEEAAKPPEPVPAQLLPGGSDDEDDEPGEDDPTDGKSARFAMQGRHLWTPHRGLAIVEIRRTHHYLTREQRASLISTNRNAIKRLGRVGAPKLMAFWKAQGERIIEAATSDPLRYEDWAQASRVGIWKPGERLFTWERSDHPDAFQLRDIADINWDEEQQALLRVVQGLHDLAGKTSFANVAKEIGVDINWDLANPKVRWVLRELATRIVGINRTTMEDVQRVVGEALDEGVSMDDLSERLTGLFEETYKNRAMTVARTESQVAYNKAHILGYQESNVVAASELADNPNHGDYDGDEDGLTCAQRNGLVVPLDKAHLHIEGTHPNCVLACLPVLYRPLGEE